MRFLIPLLLLLWPMLYHTGKASSIIIRQRHHGGHHRRPGFHMDREPPRRLAMIQLRVYPERVKVRVYPEKVKVRVYPEPSERQRHGMIVPIILRRKHPISILDEKPVSDS
ncbi:hypothetical protein COOONC_15290 [Cooperia oncophora]